MANTIELINMSNDVHNNLGGVLPKELFSNGWEVYKSEYADKNRLIETQIYKNENTKKVVLAIQGTDPKSLGDWKNNLSFETGSYPESFKDLISFAHKRLKKKFEDKGYSIQVTGFSQGGGLAELLSHTYGWGGNGQFAPGAGYIIETQDYKKHLESLNIEPKGVPNNYTTIIEKGDVVDNFGKHLSEVTKLDTIESKINNGILAFSSISIDTYNQHDIEKLNSYVLGLNNDAKKVFNYIMEIGTEQPITRQLTESEIKDEVYSKRICT